MATIETRRKPVSFAKLADEHCRYPLGDPGAPGFGFCGAAQQIGSSYCPYHHRSCYLPPDRR